MNRFLFGCSDATVAEPCGSPFTCSVAMMPDLLRELLQQLTSNRQSRVRGLLKVGIEEPVALVQQTRSQSDAPLHMQLTAGCWQTYHGGEKRLCRFMSCRDTLYSMWTSASVHKSSKATNLREGVCGDVSSQSSIRPKPPICAKHAPGYAHPSVQRRGHVNRCSVSRNPARISFAEVSVWYEAVRYGQELGRVLLRLEAVEPTLLLFLRSIELHHPLL